MILYARTTFVATLLLALSSLIALTPLPQTTRLTAVWGPLHAQQADRARAERAASRVNERIAALQREADALATESRTLVGDLRQLEIERDLQTERLKSAQEAVAAAEAGLQSATEKLAELEQQRVAQVPDLRAQLVDVYKRRAGGYARLVLEADNVRELGRVARAVAAMSTINANRIAEHRETLERLKAEQALLGKTAVERAANEADARKAQAAAERAIAARTALIAQIDRRRDLNAQLAGELQLAYQRLRTQIGNLTAGAPAERVTVPLAPFRGTLEWPVAGAVSARFGQPAARAGGGPVRSGIEVAAPIGTSVAAVHGGTIAFSDAFTGFGNLVIIDHGDNIFSVYGHLASTSVQRGDQVEVGSEVGRVGSTPAGPPALYFEMRIDGRSVDPVEWLKPR